MHFLARSSLALFAILAMLPASIRAEGPQSASAPCMRAVDSFFADEVWAKVGAQSCLTCHKAGGDAEESQFVLRDPERSPGGEKNDVLRHNRDVFARLARQKEGEEFRILLKVTGGLDHGGEDVL